jgi:RHS repeat-associated protein
MISVTNPLGKVTRYGYDQRDRRTTVTDALEQTTTTTYDNVGNVITINDPANPISTQSPPTFERVSIDSSGNQSNGFSTKSSISDDGRFIAFTSDANNLVAGDTNNARDVFVRDRQTNTTTRVSVDSSGNQANGYNSYDDEPSISNDGRFVAFTSNANNLVAGDTNNVPDVFVRDRQTNTTTRINVDSNGNQANRLQFSDYRPSASISSDGRFVTFSSDANNLVAGDTNNAPDVFVRDRQINTTTRISIDSNGNQLNGSSDQPSISSDGRFVAFTSSANNLVADDTNSAVDVFVRDLVNGTTIRIGGSQQNRRSERPSISSDGRFVAFQSSADLVPGELPIAYIYGNEFNIFVRDLQTGNTINANSNLYGVGTASLAFNPSISSDGRFITFIASTNFNPELSGSVDIFTRDLQTGATTQSNIGSTSSGASGATPSISSDGRFVAFESNSNNFVPGDTNSARDIFVVGPISFPNLPSATFTYDGNDRLTSETNALGATRTFSYDAAGNRTSLSDRNGKTREFSFDPLNRLTSEIWIGDGRTINSSYDAAGQLTQINDADATYNYAYDLDGRLLSVNNTGTAGSPSVLMSYGYDAAGNVLSAMDSINGTPAGTNTYTFDPLNRVTRMQQSGTGVTNKRVDYAYNAVGQPINVKRFSDLAGTQPVAETTHTFDSLNRLTAINHSKGGVPLAAYDYSFDANSRITGVTNRDGMSINTYDDTDQLTGVDRSFQPDEAYTYDANGNRTNPGYVTGANNRLLSDGKFNYEYDGEGNRTKRIDILTGAVTEYGWDYRNRLTQVVEKDSSGTVINQSSNTYDPNDLRIGRTENGIAERFVYGQNQNIALEFDSSGSLTNRYLYGDDIDTLLADEPTSGSVLWAFGDNLGTVRDVTDNSGTVSNHLTYGAFGNVTNETNPSSGMRFGFTGRDLDRDSGLNYYRSRYYGSDIGRFISEDRIGFAAGDANLYRYVKNSPVGAIDPSGNVKIELVLNPLVRAPVTTYPLIRGTLIPDYTKPIHRDISVNHAFVLVTDLDGTQKYYRGGPEIVPFEEQLARGDSGPIVTEFDTYPIKRNGMRSIDAINPSLQIRKVVYENKCEPASLYEPHLIRTLAIIEASYLKYFILGPNSNSVAYQLLKDIGMSTSLPSGASAPGWGIDLYFNYLEKYSPPSLIDAYRRTNIGPGSVRPKYPPPDYSNYRPDVNWDTLRRFR